ncbi:MAG: 4Fe-4S binding protein [Anaerolineae bacterium]|nr:4Fe-4S binding protein [Anaerolineae bacterium]
MKITRGYKTELDLNDWRRVIMKERRSIQIHSSFLDHPDPPVGRTPIRIKKPGDYPDVPPAYLEIARHYANPLLMGPPICDELVALVRHMFTEEEADLVQHIALPTGKTAGALAAAVHRPVEDVRSILERLTHGKGVLMTLGTGGGKRYGLMPVSPGTFEDVMLWPSEDAYTDWHRGFAKLFAALYDTGYWADYATYPTGYVRYVPVGETIDIHQTAWPAERLEEIFDKYKTFSVSVCQCRSTEHLMGRGCNKPLETCISFGGLAEFCIRHDKGRRIEKKDALEIKAEAAAAGLASYIAESRQLTVPSGSSCSCCGCCCVALRTISQFDAPGMFAPPHFVPKVNLAQCTYCTRCAKVCPVGAIIVDAKTKSRQYLPERCIGCGLCAVACDRQHAIQMEPVAKHIQLQDGKVAATPWQIFNHLRGAWVAWRKYKKLSKE